MVLCEICGNEIAVGNSVCRFCGSPQSGRAAAKVRKAYRSKVVNLERGMPVVEQALRRLDGALAESRVERVDVLTIIHGYGSSGRGGKIGRECRKTLDYRRSRGELVDYIPGEDFSRRNGKTRTLISRHPQVAADKNLDRGNRGITIVIL